MKRKTAFLLVSSSLLLAGPGGLAQEEPAKKADQAQEQQLVQLIAVIVPTAGNEVRGTVTFTPLADNKVEVTARLAGLEPLGGHGFHVHEFGDLSGTDGSTAGGHFNPEGHLHGLPPNQRRHAGDLGNLMADDDGMVTKTFVVDDLRLTGKHSILGRAVIIHAKTDTGEQPSGSAGDRIGYGVIGYRYRPDQ